MSEKRALNVKGSYLAIAEAARGARSRADYRGVWEISVPLQLSKTARGPVRLR